MDLIERLEAILAASEPADSQWRYWDSDDGAVAVNVHPSEFQAALREAAPDLRAVREAPVVTMPDKVGPSVEGSTLHLPASWAEKVGLLGRDVRLVPVGEGEANG